MRTRMMAPTHMRTGLMFGVLLLLLLSAVITGGAFYSVVLPKFQVPPAPVAPPPPPQITPLYPLTPTTEPSIPQLIALPGTTLVRLAHDTSAAHTPWGLA